MAEFCRRLLEAGGIHRIMLIAHSFQSCDSQLPKYAYKVYVAASNVSQVNNYSLVISRESKLGGIYIADEKDGIHYTVFSRSAQSIHPLLSYCS